jgi:hypothetical protein
VLTRRRFLATLGLAAVAEGCRLMPGLGFPGSAYSSYNDEFDGSSLNPAWTLNTTAMPADVYSDDVNTTKPSCFYSHVVGTNAHGYNGSSMYLWRSCPSVPFTVTAKILGADFVNTDPQDCGLGVGQANPNNGYVQVMCPSSYTGSITAKETTIWSALDVFTDTLAVTTYPAYTGPLPPYYLRLVVHSATNIDFCYSADNSTWETFQSGFNPQTYIVGWTPGSVILSNHVWNGHTTNAWWDWIRFTQP